MNDEPYHKALSIECTQTIAEKSASHEQEPSCCLPVSGFVLVGIEQEDAGCCIASGVGEDLRAITRGYFEINIDFSRGV